MAFHKIDRFSSWCEALNINSKVKEFPSIQIQYIFNKLKKTEISAEFPEMNELHCLLRQTLSRILDIQANKRKQRSTVDLIRDKITKITSNGCRILYKNTLDTTKLYEYKLMELEMKRLIDEHQKVNYCLQKQKEVMSIYDEKVNMKYRTLLNQEVKIRTTLKLMERNIWEGLKTDLKNRVNSGLEALKEIIASSAIKEFSYLLEHIHNMEKDCPEVVLNAIDRLSCRYNFTIPQVLNHSHALELADVQMAENTILTETDNRKFQQDNC